MAAAWAASFVSHHPLPRQVPGFATELHKFLLFHAIFLYFRNRIVHGIRILGIDDLPSFKSTPSLFGNKFHFGHEYFAIYCLNELIVNKRTEVKFDYYKNLPTVKNHLK